MPKEELQVEVKKLISLGKQKGYLTYEELNNTLPAEMVSSEQLSNLMTIFGEMDIEIIDGSEGERDQRKMADNEEAAEEVEEAEERETDDVGGHRHGKDQGPLERGAPGEPVGDDQPGEAGADDQRPGTDTGQQRQGVAEQLQELRSPEVGPDLARGVRERDEHGQARHRDHRGDADGGDGPRRGQSAQGAPFLPPEFE